MKPTSVLDIPTVIRRALALPATAADWGHQPTLRDHYRVLYIEFIRRVTRGELYWR